MCEFHYGDSSIRVAIITINVTGPVKIGHVGS